MADSVGQSPVVLQPTVGFSQPISTGGPFQMETYKSRQSIVVGIMLIIVGVLAVVFNIADIAINSDIEYVGTYNFYCSSGGCIGHGFWGGILTCITGILAVVAGKNRTRCLITALLILAIITMVTTGIQTIIAAVVASALRSGSETFYNCISGSANMEPCRKLSAFVAMEAVIAVMGGIAFCLCMWASILCCIGNSCCAGTPGVTYAVVTTGGPQVTVLSQQQYGQYDQPAMQQQYPLVYNPVGVPPGYQFAATPEYYPPPATALVTSQPTQPNDVKSPL